MLIWIATSERDNYANASILVIVTWLTDIDRCAYNQLDTAGWRTYPCLGCPSLFQINDLAFSVAIADSVFTIRYVCAIIEYHSDTRYSGWCNSGPKRDACRVKKNDEDTLRHWLSHIMRRCLPSKDHHVSRWCSSGFRSLSCLFPLRPPIIGI